MRFFSPFMLSTLFFAGYSIYAFSQNREGWGNLLGVIFFGFALAILVVDLFFRWLFPSTMRLFIAEGLIVGFIFCVSKLNDRGQTLVVRDNFDKEYVNIVFSVEGEDPLPIRFYSINPQITIPDDGLLLTSSHSSVLFSNTELSPQNGPVFNAEASPFLSTNMGGTRAFRSNGRDYTFRTWKIQKRAETGGSTGFSGTEMSKQKEALIKDFENKHLIKKP